MSSALSSPGAALSVLMLSLFLFESCVGMYFPTIGTLRSKYFPDSHRSVVMNLFGIPLNAMVVTVFLSIEKLGVRGALGVSTAALAVATACGLKLRGLVAAGGDRGGMRGKTGGAGMWLPPHKLKRYHVHCELSKLIR